LQRFSCASASFPDTRKGIFLGALARDLKELTLSALAFIRRFSLHILPPGLVRIRHYGILGNNRRKRALEAARVIFKCRRRALVLQPHRVTDKPMCCPFCAKAGIRLVTFTDAAGVLHIIGAGPMPYDSS
jgi:Putative transposase